MTSPNPASNAKHSPIERLFERSIFTSRWLLAPIYLGLAASLVLVLVKFAQKTMELVSNVLTSDGNEAIVDILALIDLSLVGNLVLMVMFGGYASFVSRLDIGDHKDKPDWIGKVGLGDLKLKLMTSIVAISAIHVLESFMNIGQLTDRELAWSVGMHMTFIASGVLLALMDRISGRAHA